jgi:SAM-dependent methyltransferase
MKTLFCCPRCNLTLSKSGAPLLFRCPKCGPYPALGGIPILVPNPFLWCATHHDAALAALGEAGVLKQADVTILQTFAEGVRDVVQQPFSDDWTLSERNRVASPVEPGLKFLERQAEAKAPGEWFMQRLPKKLRVLEVGCGAGLLSARIARAAKAHWVCDVSLRAVLMAKTSSRQCVAFVADATALPLRNNQFDVVIAENVIDIVDEPEALLSESFRCAPRLLLTTPDPSLGAPDFDFQVLARLAKEAGYLIRDEVGDLLWLRVNHRRFVEAYLCAGFEFERSSKK